MKKTALTMSVLATLSGFARPDINIYNGKFLNQFSAIKKKGVLVYKNGKRKSRVMYSRKARTLHNHIRFTSDFFNDEFSYDSWDGKGSPIHATYNASRFAILDLIGLRQNAAWAKDRFIFGAGKRKGLDDMEKAIDVVAHEYTHAVIDHTSKLKYEGQSGALNEHFADVFGSIVNQLKNPDLSNPFLIGESILNGELADKHTALRDMMDPSRGLNAQPSHMSQLKTDAEFRKYGPFCVPSRSNDKCGVHILSGIPNRSAALVMSKIGAREAAKLYFNVLTSLSENSNFEDYRKAMLKECKEFAADTCYYVDEALKNVGLVAPQEIADVTETQISQRSDI